MPSSFGQFTHYYEDAFHGGSCLSIDTNELIRIFTCEFPCKDNLIFSYSFKKEHAQNDLEVHLNLLNKRNSRDLKIACKREGNTGNDLTPLNQDAAQSVNIFLANKGLMPSPSFINDWETRFFLLKFNNMLSKDIIITDIGVKKIFRGRVLLGQIAIYSAVDFDSNIHVKKIHV